MRVNPLLGPSKGVGPCIICALIKIITYVPRHINNRYIYCYFCSSSFFWAGKKIKFRTWNRKRYHYSAIVLFDRPASLSAPWACGQKWRGSGLGPWRPPRPWELLTQLRPACKYLKISAVDPDPHVSASFGNLDPHPYQIKFRICIKEKSGSASKW